MVTGVTSLESDDAIVNLSQDALSGDTTAGTETTIVAKRTTAYCDGAIDIGTGKTSVDADPLYPLAVFLTQKIVVRKVAKTSFTPRIFVNHLVRLGGFLS